MMPGIGATPRGQPAQRPPPRSDRPAAKLPGKVCGNDTGFTVRVRVTNRKAHLARFAGQPGETGIAPMIRGLRTGGICGRCQAAWTRRETGQRTRVQLPPSAPMARPSSLYAALKQRAHFSLFNELARRKDGAASGYAGRPGKTGANNRSRGQHPEETLWRPGKTGGSAWA